MDEQAAADLEQKIKTVELAWRYFYVSKAIDLNDQPNMRFSPAILNANFDMMVFQLRDIIAGERVKEIKYPLDWWQAFRERWLPKFWLTRHPVRYHEWHVDLLYPQIQARGFAAPKVAIYDSERSSGFLKNPEPKP
jgi:hypothetical protein